MWNAVTAASQIADSYERATDMERIGGELLVMSLPKQLAEAAPKTSGIRNVTPMRKRLVMA